ncbi:class I SAM-dependent methyltransferase [Hamadaea tsunoensis]|uniref:class I SAM-dependent methyltransferase n=1 Tax=Hamadaea tsunoensis TaxID=53368 RepID=UPI000429BB04|nr:class I SAM-dependent methyltransferase [Hamadaea tsunoensis]
MWMINELAYAGPEHLDPAFVAGYDRKQGHPDPAPDIAEFRDHGLEPGASILDLAAGTGRFAIAAAETFAVTAADVSPAMLSYLRAHAPAGLKVTQGGFLSYTGGPFDGVHTRNGLHQLPDFFKGIALQRIADLLRPGGILRVRDLIYDFHPAEAPAVFDEWFAGAVTDPAVGYTADDYAEHIRTEYSTYRWLFEPLLEQAGFQIVSVAYERRLYGAYTCVKRP